MGAARRSIGVAVAIARKDLSVALSYRVSFVMARITVFGSVAMFFFVSKVMGSDGVFASPEAYFRFVIVGMMVGTLIQQSIGAAISGARRDQIEGTLEALAALPIGPGTLGLAWMLYPLIDAVLAIIVLGLFALPLGLSGADPSWPVLLLTAPLVVAAFAGLGLFGAALVIAFQQGAGLIAFLLSFIAIISGTLFPVSVMPQWLQTISWASPLRHALDAARAGLLDGASIADASDSLIVLAAFAVVLLPLGVFALGRGLDHARKTGRLSSF